MGILGFSSDNSKPYRLGYSEKILGGDYAEIELLIKRQNLG
jgi:hypothetical protein